jgi:hypothetical protein
VEGLKEWPIDAKQTILKEVQSEIKRLEDERLRQEAEAERRRQEAERMRRGREQVPKTGIQLKQTNTGVPCSICRANVVGAKCARCKTIYWNKVFQAKVKQRAASVVPGDFTGLRAGALGESDGLHNGQAGRPRANSADSKVVNDRQYAEDRQRRVEIRLEVSHSAHYFTCDLCHAQTQQAGLCENCLVSPLCRKCNTRYQADNGFCPKCEIRCAKCKRVYDSSKSYCPHCNTDLRVKLCKQCKANPASGPSGQCKACAQRPATVPVSSSYEERKAQPQPREYVVQTNPRQMQNSRRPK